jgi:hypothetical protein
MERCSPGGRATPHRLPATRAAARESGAASAPFLCRHSVRSMWGFPDTPVPALWWFPGQIPPSRQVVRRGTLGHVFANCAAEIGHGPLPDLQDRGAQGTGLRGGATLLRDLRITLRGLGFEELSVIPPPAQHPTSLRCPTPFCRRWCPQGFCDRPVRRVPAVGRVGHVLGRERVRGEAGTGRVRRDEGGEGMATVGTVTAGERSPSAVPLPCVAPRPRSSRATSGAR